MNPVEVKSQHNITMYNERAFTITSKPLWSTERGHMQPLHDQMEIHYSGEVFFNLLKIQLFQQYFSIFKQFCNLRILLAVSVHPSHIGYKGGNVNTDCDHERAIHNSGNVVIMVWWDFSRGGAYSAFRWETRKKKKKKKTLQTYAAAETMKG